MRDFQKEAKELLPKFEKDLVKYWDEAMELLLDYNVECGQPDILPSDMLNEIVVDQAQKWGWERVACFLAEVSNNMNEDYYWIDAYGNARPITYHDIEMWLDDIANGF